MATTDLQSVLFLVPAPDSPDGPEPMVVAMIGDEVKDSLMEFDFDDLLDDAPTSPGLYVWAGEVVACNAGPCWRSTVRPATAADLRRFRFPVPAEA